MPGRALTILTVLGTRPEVIKLSPVLRELGRRPGFKSVVVSTSQHREMIDPLFEYFSIRPDHDLKIMREEQSLAEISLGALAGLDPLLGRKPIDLVLVQGDTTTAMIGALAAFYRKIPVGHVEAGLRTFDKTNPYPEEVNRRLIATLSELHFAPTAADAENLRNEGTAPEGIFVTGNPGVDSLGYLMGRRAVPLGDYLPAAALAARRLVLATAHRRENWGAPLGHFCLALKELAGRFPDIHIVYPVHMNPNVRRTVFAHLEGVERVHLTDPLPYPAFVQAMDAAHLILTDSGGIQEEGVSLQRPVLVFRRLTERSGGISAGGAKLVGLERESLVREAALILDDPAAHRAMIAGHDPHGDGRAAGRIVQAILYSFGRGERPADFVPIRHDSVPARVTPRHA
jgi:UDP-N-acetylglucosamine 2-epimerase (non-hydrolysing)